MLELPLFVLVLQIGFNAALKHEGNNQNLLIPSSGSISYGQTRRLDSNHYLPHSTRRFSASDSDQFDSEDSSLEESSYRALRPLQDQRRNNRNTRSDNDVSLEMAPVGRISSDNYADSAIRQTSKNFRRPYLRHRPHNLRKSINRKNNRRGDDDLTVEVSSDDQNSPQDSLEGSRAKEVKYLRSLLSLIENSPIDGLDPDEDAVENSQTSRRARLGDTRHRESQLSNNGQSYNRRSGGNLLKSLSDRLVFDEDNANSNSLRSFYSNYRRNNRKITSDSRLQMPSPTKENPDAYIDTVFLLGGEGKPDDIAIARPQLRNQATNRRNNKNYRRRYSATTNSDSLSNDRLSLHEDANLYGTRGLNMRLRSRKLTNDSPNVSLKNYRNIDGSIDLESLFGDKLNSDDDNSESLSVSSTEVLQDSQKLKSRNQNQQYIRPDNDRNFLRLAVSPNDGLSLDEDLASSLSVLLKENLDNLNLVPVTNLRSGVLSNQKNNRRSNYDTMLKLSASDRQSAEDDTSSNLSDLHLGSSRNRKSRTHNNNLRSNKKDDETKGIELVLTDKLKNNTAVDLVPYHERRKNESTKNMNNGSKNDEFDDEFNLESLFTNREDDVNDQVNELSSNDRLNLDEDAASDLLVLRPTNLDSPNEIQSNRKDTDDTLNLEFPWNGQLSPDDDANSNLSAFRGLKTQLRSREHTDSHQSKDPKDYELKLEYPWNTELSPNNNKDGNLSKSRLTSREDSDKLQSQDPKNYELKLEYPWNGKLSPNHDENGNVSKSRLRSREHNINLKDYELKLEYPWNGEMSPGDVKKSSSESVDHELKSRLRTREYAKDHQIKNKYTDLVLEFPWNDKLTSDNTANKNPTSRAMRIPDPLYEHPYLRKQNKNSYTDRRTNIDFQIEDRHLAYQDDSETNSKSYLKKSGRGRNDNKSVQYQPGVNFADNTRSYIALPLDRRPHPRLRSQHGKPLYFKRRANEPVATTISPNIATANEMKAYNDTIIFPDN